MLEVKNLEFSYSSQVILEDINLTFNEGECVAILGNNGAGKSTLVKCLNKINPIQKGEVLLNNQNINKLSRNEIAKQIAYVAQAGEVTSTTVFDTVLLGRMPYIKYGPTEKDYEIVEETLKLIKIQNLALRHINQMSGGQVQKVLLARALCQQPKILILDEPTNNLDMKSQHMLLGLVEDIVKEKNICVIQVLHDINLAMRYCNKFVFIKDKKIYTVTDKEGITEDIIKSVFDINASIETVAGQKAVVFLGQNKEIK